MQNECHAEFKGWADFGAKHLLGQFSQLQRRMTAAPHCRSSNQTTVSQLLRLGVKWKVFTRHNTGKIKTLRKKKKTLRNTSSSSMLG